MLFMPDPVLTASVVQRDMVRCRVYIRGSQNERI